jgi:hypothetical protein
MFNSMVLDGSGNIYVAGWSWSISSTPSDIALTKYDPNGNRLWSSLYDACSDSDRANALAVDGQGNVYVTGRSRCFTSGDDIQTVKYDANGNKLWSARYVGSGSGDEAYAIAVDSQGNVYVAGRYNLLYSAYDYLTLKYDTNGNLLWAVQFAGDPSVYMDDIPVALALDAQGNVYVTGYSPNLVNSAVDYVTVKYDANGNELWVARRNGAGNWVDIPTAIAVDTQGNVYVTGYSTSSFGANEYLTVKYDTNGNELWAARYDGGVLNASDTAYALALDSQGNVYVTGVSGNSSGNFDYATVKYDPNGVELWVARYNGPINGQDIARAIAVDSQGSVYVTGESAGAGTQGDFLTIKYDTNGNQLWLARYNGPNNTWDAVRAIALDRQGSVYVVGESSFSSVVVKYVQCPGLCPADLNGDQIVDDADLLQVLFAFGSSGSNLGSEDVNYDQVVDDADLLMVLFAFGSGC